MTSTADAPTRMSTFANALRKLVGDADGLQWRPVMLEAKHFIYWGKETENQLAAQINQVLIDRTSHAVPGTT